MEKQLLVAGALLSFVTVFFNFIPLWISPSRAPLSFLPPFDPPKADVFKAGGGGGPGGGGGGGGIFHSIFHWNKECYSA